MSNNILIGTSGFRFSGERSWYPKGLPQDRYLEYYSQYFDILEINTTYYALPNRSVFERFVDLTPEHFQFIVKLPSSLTHGSNSTLIIHPDYNPFSNIITPFIQKNRLAGILAQFPNSFKRTHENIKYIIFLRDHFKKFDFFIEFRSKSWIAEDVFQILKDRKIGIVSVDEPDLPDLLPRKLWQTNGIYYYRLHSRDSSKWYEDRDSRYDYYYTETELNEIKDSLSSEVKDRLKALVFFNNCHQGSAFKNAEKLRSIKCYIYSYLY